MTDENYRKTSEDLDKQIEQLRKDMSNRTGYEKNHIFAKQYVVKESDIPSKKEIGEDKT